MFLRRASCIGFVCLMALGGCKNEDPIQSENAPLVSKIKPAQVSRGQQDVKAKITGDNFIGIVTVDFGPGVELKTTTLVSATQLSVVLSVHPEAASGPRTVTITTPSGRVETSEMFSIKENAIPSAHFTVSSSQAGKGEPFSFDATASDDSDGSIEQYAWDFGDGATGTGATIQHSYSSAGSFHVVLTVTDNGQSKSTATRDLLVIDNKPPVPRFSVSPKNGDTHTVFTFDASNSQDPDGRITRYLWTFNDGHKADGKRVTHVFRESGAYDVTLTATDNDQSQTEVTEKVKIAGIKPIAAFSVSPESGSKTTTFHFNASASHDPDGSIEEFLWSLDDGTTRSGVSMDHQFASEGDHSAQLTVTDDDGSQGTVSKTIHVGSDDGGGGGGGEAGMCPAVEQVIINDGGNKPFCDSFKLPRTFGPDHPVTVMAVYDKNEHRVLDIRVYNGDDNESYCCQDVFHLCTEFRNTSGVYVFGASAFQIGPFGKDGRGDYRDYYLYRGGAETFGHWPPVPGQTLFAHFVQCK